MNRKFWESKNDNKNKNKDIESKKFRDLKEKGKAEGKKKRYS